MDQYTFRSVLAVCERMRGTKEGKELHGYIVRTGHQENVFVGGALIDLYGKCSNIRYAETVFSRMSYKNTVTWTTMLVGYSQSGRSEEAITTFCRMQKNFIEPDDFTLGSAISSCADLSSLEDGVQFHNRALVSGLISFIAVANSLITMYGRCGMIEESLNLFKEMKFRDVISWTALIRDTSNLVMLLKRSVYLRKPDEATFVGVLSACSRAGLVEKGQLYFESMVKDHGINAISDHYTCIIDLFSRAGKLEEAKNFISEIPFVPDAITWGTILSSCRVYRNMEIGKWAADSLFELNPQHPASYVLLSSIYAANGNWCGIDYAWCCGVWRS